MFKPEPEYVNVTVITDPPNIALFMDLRTGRYHYKEVDGMSIGYILREDAIHHALNNSVKSIPFERFNYG